MTTDQLTVVLDTQDINLNTWVEINYFTIIFLNQDSNIFINNLTSRYRFNSTNELLEIAYGSTDEEGTFTTIHGETDSEDFIVDSYIDFELIAGLISSSIRLYSNTYMTSPF